MSTYHIGASLPDLAVTWLDDDGDVIDFSSGWTFVARVGSVGAAATLNKTSGFTGASTAPNVTVQWSASDITDLGVGTHTVTIIATRTSDSKVRIAQVSLVVADVVAAP